MLDNQHAARKLSIKGTLWNRLTAYSLVYTTRLYFPDNHLIIGSKQQTEIRVIGKNLKFYLMTRL